MGEEMSKEVAHYIVYKTRLGDYLVLLFCYWLYCFVVMTTNNKTNGVNRFDFRSLILIIYYKICSINDI